MIEAAEELGKNTSVSKACQVLGVSRSSLYYRPSRDESREAFEWRVLNAIDRLYTDHPHLGRYGMQDALAQEYEIEVNPKRVRRLMKTLGLQAVYPRPRRNTSQPCREHTKYPYLLRNLEIVRPDQVWCADITYIRLYRGFAYLVAVMDWHTRAVLSWRLSNTIDSSFCVEALEEALSRYGKPEIFNTDQGSQFTSEEFTDTLSAAGVRISMDGKGRWMDNVFIERLWRTVKYENIYLKDYETVDDLITGLDEFFRFYSRERPHQSLHGQTPWSVYQQRQAA